MVRFLDRRTPPHILTLILIAGVSALSMNMFLPSLPSMTAHFQTDYSVMQLSVSLYLLVSTVPQLILGPISDRVGRRQTVLIGLSIFVAASFACAFAPTIEMFLLCRMVQTAVAVGMVLSRAIVRDMVPQDQAASMIGYVTMGMAVVPMLGPAIGGVLGETFGWQANFWALGGLGLAIALICWADLGETNRHQSTSFLEQVRQYPELLTAPRFWGYALAAAFGSGAFFAYLGGAPFVGTAIYGLSEAQLGSYFSAPAVGYFTGNFFSGRYSARFGINTMIVTGAIIVTLGMAAALGIFYAGYGSVSLFFGFMTFVGLGNGLLMPNSQAGLLSVRPHIAGSASGLGGAIMIGGGACLSALAGSALTHETGAYPLLWIMLLTSAMSLLAILFVIYRTRSLQQYKAKNKDL